MNKLEDRNAPSFQLSDPTVASLESEGAPEGQSGQTSPLCEQTAANLDSMDKSKAQNVLQTWSDYWQTLTLRARSWRASVSEKLHPCLLIPLLTAIDVLYWCLAGLIVIGAVVLFLAVSLIAGTFIMVLVYPCLGLFFWLLLHTTPISDEKHLMMEVSPSLFLRQVSCVLATVLLYHCVCTLPACLWKRNRSAYEFKELDAFHFDLDILPIVPRVLAYFACYVAFSALFGFYLCDVTLMAFYVFYIAYNLFLFCYWITSYIHWYGLLVAVILVPLFITTLVNQIKSYKPIEGNDKVEGNAHPTSRPPV